MIKFAQLLADPMDVGPSSGAVDGPDTTSISDNLMVAVKDSLRLEADRTNIEGIVQVGH